MKKILLLVSLMTATASVSFGQTVMGSKFFENMYLGINGGIQAPLESEGGSHIHPVAGLEIGKDFTPVMGLSVDGNLIFKEDGQNDAIQRFSAGLNTKINLSNWIGSYKGYPRKVEFLLVPGFGWGLSRKEDYTYTNGDQNYLSINTFAQINFNLGQNRSWVVNIKPGVVWNSFNIQQGEGKVVGGVFRSSAADFRITAGVAYRFKSKRTGSNNFVLCPYSVTKDDFDKVVGERDELQAELNKGPKVVEKEVVREKEVEVPVYVSNGMFVSFKINNAVVSPVEKVKLKQWVSNVPAGKSIAVIGSADSATGTKSINDNLSNKRAEAVKKIIIEECGIDASKVNVSTQIDINPELGAASRAAYVEIVK